MEWRGLPRRNGRAEPAPPLQTNPKRPTSGRISVERRVKLKMSAELALSLAFGLRGLASFFRRRARRMAIRLGCLGEFEEAAVDGGIRGEFGRERGGTQRALL